MTQTRLLLFFTCTTHTHNRLATVYCCDHNIYDTHTEYNFSLLHLTYRLGSNTSSGSRQLLSLAANATVTQVIGT